MQDFDHFVENYNFIPGNENFKDDEDILGFSEEDFLFDYSNPEHIKYVLSIANSKEDYEHNRIWTLLDCDGDSFVKNGYHLVNRIGYFITEEPGEDGEEYYYGDLLTDNRCKEKILNFMDSFIKEYGADKTLLLSEELMQDHLENVYFDL